MGFEPFDPYGEWEKNKHAEPKEGQTDALSTDTPLYVEADFADADFLIEDEQKSTRDREASTVAEEPVGSNQPQATIDDRETAEQPQAAVNPMPNQPVAVEGVWKQWSAQTGRDLRVQEPSSPSVAQDAKPFFPQDAKHVPVNAVPQYQMDQIKRQRMQMEMKPPKKRIGMYVLLSCILLVSLLTLVAISVGFFSLWSSLAYYEDNFYSGTTEKEIRMPAIKPIPKGGRSVPKFGSPKTAYQFADTLAPTAEIKEAVGPAVVGVVNKVFRKTEGENKEYRNGGGSGIVLSEDGYIVTNYHVIADCDKVYVVFEGEKDEVPAELIGYDDIRDVAVLKVALNQLTAPIYGDSNDVKAGEMAVAIGNPLGTLEGTITQGIISAASREITLEAGRKQDFIQTDTAINPGNSGGALLNGRGEVIGMNTRKETTVAFDDWGLPVAAEGIGYAIPINDVLDIADTLIRNGRIERAQLGVTLQTVMPNENNVYETHPGALVMSVIKGGPADEAGIRKDDIIIEFDGQKVEALGDISNGLEKKAVGEKAQITVWRNGKELNYVVTLQDLKDDQ